MKWRARILSWSLCALVPCLAAPWNGAASEHEPNTDWWSFKPAQRPAVPETGSKWVRNEVDQFILQTLTRTNLTPSPEADRRTLIRRVTFDLTGLPPSPEEVEVFINDRSTNAYEKLVDQLLISPRYGERWARHWLDAVHYGETHGYDKDKPRLNAWRYRDYVIAAFNEDKPYSRFVEEQLAADVLFPDEPRLTPALGFIAAGPWDFVGHVELPITKTDGLIARYNDRDDMVMNTISTFQSLTVHCARCHDHKFDPISQRDYYGLQAVFAGVDRADRAFDADRQTARLRGGLKERVRELEAELKRVDEEMARMGGEELRSARARVTDLERGSGTAAAFGYHSQVEAGAESEKWVQVDLGKPMAIGTIELAPCHDDFNNIGAGFGFPPRFKIEVGNDPELAQGSRTVLDRAGADYPNPGIAVQRFKLNETARYVRLTATRLAPRKGDFILALSELRVLSATGENAALGAKVTALDSIESPPRWRKANLVDGIYPALTNATERLAQAKKEQEAVLLRLVPETLRSRREAADRDLGRARSELAGLPKERLVYAAASEFPPSGSFLPARTPRPVHLLRRGDVKRAGDEMKPAALARVPGMSPELAVSDLTQEGQRRAALARWITDTNNMLTRRSIVNRIWSLHFGAGIVDTPNDFGRMGGVPSHPELLDWLAFRFLENGESFKRLHRLIVTSATYRQESAARPEPSRADAGNRLLWRMNRRRLDAEQFRDALLAISGRLDPAMGGPPVQQFGFRDDHSPVYDYASFDVDGAGANRRSIYRFIVRSVPDPFMDALDCPDANTLTPVRNVTTTALQALATLNDRFVLRTCEHLAARLQREQPDLESQAARAFELGLNRRPSAHEQARLVAHARRHGLASACRVLVNSNEFMFLD